MRFGRRLTGSWRDEELGRTREVGALLLGRECAGKVPLASPRRGGWQDPTERPAAAPACSPGTGLGSSHDAPLSASPVHPHVVLLRSLKLLPSRCLHFPYPTLTFHFGPFRPPRHKVLLLLTHQPLTLAPSVLLWACPDTAVHGGLRLGDRGQLLPTQPSEDRELSGRGSEWASTPAPLPVPSRTLRFGPCQPRGFLQRALQGRQRHSGL